MYKYICISHIYINTYIHTLCTHEDISWGWKGPKVKNISYLFLIYILYNTLNDLSAALALRLSHGVRCEISTYNILLKFRSISDFRLSDYGSNLCCYLFRVASVLEAAFCHLYPQGKLHCVLGLARPSIGHN